MIEDIKNFLPQYLSPKTTEKLLSDLKQFPENIDKRLYGFEGKEECVIYQGDGLDNLLIINLPDLATKTGNGIMLSNTCDIDLENQRKFSSNMVYAPIINLNKYIKMLEDSKTMNADALRVHIDDIRHQRITQIFYLPQYGSFEESFVFLDRVISIDNESYDRATLAKHRLFSLSQYGLYLFLYKISIHFTRFHERVDRVY
jgi:hypothetical protein